MDKDSDKEGGIEIRDGGCWTDAETPCETLDPVGCVVWFTGVGPPARGKEAVTVSGLDVGWVLDGSPGELGEVVWFVSRSPMDILEGSRT